MEPDLERDHNPEVSAPTAKRPEQIRVLLLARANELAVRQHHLGGEKIVESETVLPSEPSAPASERESGDPDGRDRSSGGRESMLLRRFVEHPPSHAGADPGGSRPGVDLQSIHSGQIDHESIVRDRSSRVVVASAADRNEQAVLARHVHGSDHVVGAGAVRDGGRMTIEAPVPDCTCLVVTRIARGDQVPADRSSECIQNCTVDDFPLAHALSSRFLASSDRRQSCAIRRFPRGNVSSCNQDGAIIRTHRRGASDEPLP